ncbi:MAG: DUF805 domain-containing protein, partial [Planctomycetota bacterium]
VCDVSVAWFRYPRVMFQDSGINRLLRFVRELFINYVRVLKRSLRFSGRAGRKEFWLFSLANLVFCWMLGRIDTAFETPTYRGVQLLEAWFSLVVVLPGIAVAVRRLHDADCRGWWLLIVLLPIFGIFIVFALLTLPGDHATNRFGNVPD